MLSTNKTAQPASAGFFESYAAAKEMRSVFCSKEHSSQFIEKYQGLIQSLAVKAIRLGNRSCFEDLFQNGVLGLLMAKERYTLYSSRGKKVSFGAYAYHWIKSMMFNNSPDDFHDSLDSPISSDDEDDSFLLIETIASPLPSVADQFIEGELSHDLWQAVDSLSKKEREVILLRFKKDMSLESVGRLLNCTRENVRQIEAKAIRKLRHNLIHKEGS